MAMNIGAEADPGRIRPEHWRALAEAIGMRAGFINKEITSVADAIREAMPEVRGELEEEHGPLPMLQLPEMIIRTQLRMAGVGSDECLMVRLLPVNVCSHHTECQDDLGRMQRSRTPGFLLEMTKVAM